jgi:HAD superfamily hydrolase (TIGR01549 family)
MVSAVVFDWGGVLIDNPWEDIVSYCAEHAGMTKGDIERIFREFGEQFQRGCISEMDLWRRGNKKFKTPIPKVEMWGSAFRYAYKERPKVFSYARELKAKGLKTGFLSNTEIAAMEFFYEQGYDMFDALVFSCEVGFVKPEKQIFEIMAKRLDLPAGEIVFTDDRVEFVKGAKDAGLIAVHFRTLGQFKRELGSVI